MSDENGGESSQERLGSTPDIMWVAEEYTQRYYNGKAIEDPITAAVAAEMGAGTMDSFALEAAAVPGANDLLQSGTYRLLFDFLRLDQADHFEPDQDEWVIPTPETVFGIFQDLVDELGDGLALVREWSLLATSMLFIKHRGLATEEELAAMTPGDAMRHLYELVKQHGSITGMLGPSDSSE